MEEELNKIVDVKDSEPSSDKVISFLLSQTKESPFLDFKRKIDITKNSDFPKIVKDVLAFANNGGGWIMIGVKENDYLDPSIKGSFIFEGLPDNFEIDQATLQEKINAYLDEPFEIGYSQFFKKINGVERKFGLIHIPPSFVILKPKKDGEYTIEGKKMKAFSTDDVFTRRGTQSILASKLEFKWIKERIKDKNYRHFLLKGDPDKVNEKLYSNLFEVTSFPNTVYVAEAKFDTIKEDRECLQMTYPMRSLSPLKYRRFEDKIISFQDLSDITNPLHNIVDSHDIKSETIFLWLDGLDKERIVISLLNKELVGHAVKVGLNFYYNRGMTRLFFPTNTETRMHEWNSRFKGKSKRIVAQKRWSTQLKKFVFLHAAIQCAIIKINDKFFLRLNPTFLVTEDGEHVSSGLKEGAMITEKSYRIFNRAYLTYIFFWIDCLTQESQIRILKDFTVSTEPVTTTIDHGIAWDMPSMEIKSFIKEYDEDEDSQLDEDSAELLGEEGILENEYV